MQIWIYVLGALAMLLSIAVSVFVAMQSTKEKGLSGTITGSAADSFMGKSGTMTKDMLFSRLTLIGSIVLVVVIAVLTVLVGKAL